MEKGELEKKAQINQQLIVGVDEVGRGCLAGPVYAAAVVFDLGKLFDLDSKKRALIRDSKLLSAKQRSSILPVMQQCFMSFGIGSSSTVEIEQQGIVGATFQAMKRALAQLCVFPHLLLVDGRAPLPDYHGKQKALVKGDRLSFSIAAASILAKEARDKFMKEQSKTFDVYGFETHVGYGTKKHLEAIALHGICELHRKNFAPIRQMVS